MPAGGIGMGREVRRLVHVRAGEELVSPVGSGDLVVYAAAPAAEGHVAHHDPVLSSLLGSGVTAVITDMEPDWAALQAADRTATPLVTISDEVDAEELSGVLARNLDLVTTFLNHERTEIRREFSDLVRAGGTASMVLQRLVELSGKAVARHGPNARVADYLHAVLQHLDHESFKRGIDASDADVQRWLVDTPDSAVRNILYVEIREHQLVRLFAPLWIDGQFAGGLSLVGRPLQMSTRDRLAVLAAVQAMTRVNGRTTLDLPECVDGRRCLTLAVRSTSASLDEVAAAARRVFGTHALLVQKSTEHVAAVLANDGGELWQRRDRLDAWRTAIAADVGAISMGYADYCGGGVAELERALVWAGEAVLIGDEQHGPGHITSYADAQLAKFFGSSRGAQELRTLYERVIGRLAQEDPKRERGLLETLDVYCEAVSIVETAERLKVHRNTVLYRLKHIQEMTSLDVNDGASRLLVQLGLIAGRFAGEARRHASPPDVPHSIAQLFGVVPGTRCSQPRTV